MLELSDCLKERLAFDISDCSAYFDDSDMSFLIRKVSVELALDLICDMRDNLYGTSAVVSATFFLKNGPVDLTGCNIGIFIKILVNKSFVVTKVKVSFSAVLGNKYFTVLNGVHCSRVDIDVRVELLHCNLVAARLQQSSE